MQFNNINISFEDKILYNNFSIEFQEGDINYIIGESGVGKTTLIKYIKDKLILGGSNVSVVFQESRLIPWKNTNKNLEIVIKNKFEKEERKRKINDMLNNMNLLNCSKLYPYELSGGMKQRVSIARAILYDGDVFIMDEPFKGLDKENKENVIKFVKEYIYKNGKTAIIISHDMEEVNKIADKIILLKNQPVDKEIIE